MSSVVQDWVGTLPMKLQTAMLCAIRGCDGVAREDIMKVVARGIRKMTLLPSRQRVNEPGGFMCFELGDLREACDKICEDVAKYPTHYIHHIYLACEVLGYFHPMEDVRREFLYVYLAIVKELNLCPETREQCMERGARK
jgi:hypothetical protein